MSEKELIKLLDDLRSYPIETEWIEFKHNRSIDNQQIGEYISALSNSANLNNQSFGYLVWGVDDSDHNIVGTTFKLKTIKEGNQDLEFWLNQNLNPKINIFIYEFKSLGFNISLIKISPAIDRPIKFKHEAFVRIGTNKTNLKNYPEKERQIWLKAPGYDWSAQIVQAASILDLDTVAILKARETFKQKSKEKSIFNDIDNWDDATFLDKAKLTINGKITNASLILLGKPESTHYLSPSVARITWKLESEESGYEHFDPPFFLTINNLYHKIRNYNYKILPANSITAIEISKYEQWIILEALNNCIAHQDYSLNSRINVIEKTDELFFSNAGKFIEGNLEEYLFKNKTPEKYRNNFLAQAMVNLGMIDTVGHGIKKMFVEQKKRYLPLPEYDFSSSDKVTLRIYGRVINEYYSKLLIEKADLDLYPTFLLDKVQKNQQLTKDEYQLLKKLKLIEGRYPNIFVTSKIASITGDKSTYIKNKAFDSAYYKNLIIEYLKEYKSASRQDINKLLLDKISDVLNDQQKLNKIRNLLSELSLKDNKIKNIGSKTKPLWTLQ
jgi:ATP-dependent DNA helicase RecG